MPPSPPSLPNSPVTSCGKIQSSSRLRTDRRSPRMRRPLKIEMLSESTLSRGIRSGAIHIPSYQGMNVESWQRIKRDHRSSAFLSPFKETSGNLSAHYHVIYRRKTTELHCIREISSRRFSSPEETYFSLSRQKKQHNMTANIASICGLSSG